MRTKRLALVGVALTVFLGACAGGDGMKETSTEGDSDNGVATTKVAVKDFVFAPEAIKVKTGDTVTWTNEDDFDHSVQIDSLELESPKFGPMTAPVSYSYQFTKAGTYEYLCGVHNSMTGTVVVTS